MALSKKVFNKVLNVCFYLCLPVLLWSMVQVFCVASFRIPTDSMEPALEPGDYILVNKLIRGARLFNAIAALDHKEFDVYRMPGTSSFKRNDILVFNFPYPVRKDSIGFDMMQYYVKRCIALPGDTLEIRDGFFYVNGARPGVGNQEMQHYISTLPDTLTQGVVMKAYPSRSGMGWTIKTFGPLPVPAKGQEVQMNRENWHLYHRLIHWEQKKRPVLAEDGTVYLGDSLLTSYRFTGNYYFVAGDKLHNSQDSRYWGMLPEEFIVGRADYIWFSKSYETGKVNRKRLLKKVR